MCRKQRVRAAHHKQLSLFWNPLAPFTIGVSWRPAAFPSTVDTALEDTALKELPRPPTAGSKAGVGGKKQKRQQQEQLAALPESRWSAGVAVDEDVVGDDSSAGATAALLLHLADSVAQAGAGLVLDVML